MVADDLKALKKRSGLSWQALSDLTGIPVSTVRNTISGTTVSPSHEVVCKLQEVMEASLPEEETPSAAASTPTEETMQELYELRIADLKDTISDLKFLLRKEQKEKLTFISLFVGLSAFVLIVLLMDLSLGNTGWFRH